MTDENNTEKKERKTREPRPVIILSDVEAFDDEFNEDLTPCPYWCRFGSMKSAKEWVTKNASGESDSDRNIPLKSGGFAMVLKNVDIAVYKRVEKVVETFM